MQRPWIISLAASVAVVLVVGLVRLTVQVTELANAPRADPLDLQRAQAEIDRLESELGRAHGEITALRKLDGTTALLQERVAKLDGAWSDTARALDEQRGRFEGWEATKDEVGARLVDERIQDFKTGAEERWQRLGEVAHAALDLAQSAHHEFADLERGLQRDEDRMWHDLVGPIVQLIGEETVGSGVLLPSEPVPDSEEFRTHMITAWHVVRDIQGGAENVHVPIPVTIYMPDHRIFPETAELVNYDPEIDAALLRLNTTRRLDCGAKLATRETLANVKTFEPIYAVGCPLGNDPIPTFGEIADTYHQVDGSHYWMISAPTYVGNSGGGIFDAETHELLGIFSKIYTHGSLRPTVIPHMGLVTPMTTIYEWLDRIGMASLETLDSEGEAHVASAKR